MSKPTKIILEDNIFIVTETDERGIITKADENFLSISGYYIDEVLGKPHNIVRHPDMPKSTFENLWNTIKAGETWSGFIKNLTKDGDYYWTYATISPFSHVDGSKGYTSIRQKITNEEILREEMKLSKLKK
jgi:aerotaxis receptor